jgi:polar amino acid transport system permease protein
MSTNEHDGLPVHTPRRYGELIAGVIVTVIVAWVLYGLLSNDQLDLAVVPQYLFSPAILNGVVQTLLLTALSMIIGIVLGLASAVARVSSNRVLAAVAWFYVWFFRGTPVLVQLIFWFNLGILVQQISFGVPFGPTFFAIDTNDLITPLTAALLGLGLNEGAYMSEIVRAGVLSVDAGQTEAARALGMSKGTVMRVVVLPQAMRVIVPPTGNELIGLLKTTSLASVISFNELLGASSRIYSSNLKVLELLVVVSIWYLAITSVLSIGQYYLERSLAAGNGLASTPTFGVTIRDGVLGRRAKGVRRGSIPLDPTRTVGTIGSGEEQR